MLIAGVTVAGCGSASHHASPRVATPAASTGSSASAAAGPYSYSGGSTTGASASGGSSSSAASQARLTTKHSKLGTILAAGPRQLTVYMFEGDSAGKSSCNGACAQAWPPVTTSGRTSVSGLASSADLGTISRSDGSKQVTYKGHPLYLFIRDKDAGDVYGQGVHAFGADWYALAPSGEKVDNS